MKDPETTDDVKPADDSVQPKISMQITSKFRALRNKLINYKPSLLVKFIVVTLAYLLTAKLGLMVPYKESVVTLIWLPTGIAVAAIMRWGYISLPAIFIAAFVAEFFVQGLSFFTTSAIACGNTLAPMATAYLLTKLQFNHQLIKQKDIALLFSSALLGMLISAGTGVLSLYLSHLALYENLVKIGVTWWVSDSIGVMLALPLLLNISRNKLHFKRIQVYQLIAWLVLFILCMLVITTWVPSINQQFMLSIFLMLPFLIWATVNYGLVGGSVVVISLSTIAVWLTAHGYGYFHHADKNGGLAGLWTLMLTLVIIMLQIAVMQSERRLAVNALRSNEKKLRAVIDGALDGIMTIDNKGALIEFNPAAERIFGYKKEQVMGRLLSEVIVPPSMRKAHTEKHQQFVLTGKKHLFDKRVELTGMRSDGSEFPVELTLTSLHDDGLAIVTGFLRDISQQKKAQQEIESLAYTDMLTGLPNRRLLIDRFQRTLISCKRANTYAALIFIDLDHFKLLNDSKGHDAGDKVLIEVASRIKATIREGDTVARLSGDEFTIIIENLDSNLITAHNQAGDVAQKLLSALNQTYQFELFEFKTTASLGITLCNDDSKSFEQSLRQADHAMYQAKAAGRNAYRFYDAQSELIQEKKRALETSLSLALANNEFYLHYQCIVNADKKIVGAEVLLRWSHTVLGNISPLEFIPIVEKNNQIIKIGYWVLQQACLQIKQWQSLPALSKIKLSINISAKQFLYVNFVEEITDLIEETGIDAKLLMLELTETAMIDNVESVVRNINRLKAIGVKVAIDDFGIGQSSLTYLKKLPVTQIKIDQSFVQNVLTDANDAVIVQMILAVGKAIECSIVAEGIEKIEQFDALKKQGCDYFQGYYFSKPLSCNDFVVMISNS